MCNLSEVIIRADDTEESIKRKVRLATVLGTYQSTLTYFPYLRKIWVKNTEEERLLGVSMTGIMDNKITSGQNGLDSLKTLLESFRQVAVDTNAEIADEIGIQHSAAITAVKPSGTVSQLVDSASGIHTRHSNFYIRSVRADNKDPLTSFLKDRGVPNEPDVTKPAATTVFYFPIKAPEGSLTRDSLTAIEHLEIWKIYQEHWCEHKPSITVTVKEPEWVSVGSWVYSNFDAISGVSFLPHSDHSYRQAPYQECTEEEYEVMKLKMPPKIDWTELSLYEQEDNTTGMQSLACSSGDGSCEVVDLV